MVMGRYGAVGGREGGRRSRSIGEGLERLAGEISVYVCTILRPCDIPSYAWSPGYSGLPT